MIEILWSVSNSVIMCNGIKWRELGYRLGISIVITCGKLSYGRRRAINIDVRTHYRIYTVCPANYSVDSDTRAIIIVLVADLFRARVSRAFQRFRANRTIVIVARSSNEKKGEGKRINLGVRYVRVNLTADDIFCTRCQVYMVQIQFLRTCWSSLIIK